MQRPSRRLRRAANWCGRFSKAATASLPKPLLPPSLRFGAAFQGYFHYQAPEVTQREKLTIRLGLKDPSGRLIHASEMEWRSSRRSIRPRTRRVEVAIVGQPNGRAWKLAKSLGLQPHVFSPTRERARLALVDDVDAFEMVRGSVLSFAEEGARRYSSSRPRTPSGALVMPILPSKT